MTPNRRRGRSDYDEIAPWLPPQFDSILDIGCGGAWVDIFIAIKHGLKAVHLMDGETVGEKRNGFHDAGLPWWSVEPGAARVRARTKAQVFTHKPDPSLTIPVDVVMSLKSWAHHYPASHYLPLAQRSLSPGGLLIVDIRRDTDGERTIADGGFQKIGSREHGDKCQRVVYGRV